MKMQNIGTQMQAFGQAVTKGLPSQWDKNGGDLVDDMGDQLDDMIRLDVFSKAMSPTGAPWAPYSPLTKDIYRAQGKQLKLGGDTLKRSFQIGQRGNLWKPGKFRFQLGSTLRARGKLVARGFQAAYRFPRSDKAAAKMRRYLGALTGKGAPKKGGKLTHPARKIVGWKPSWSKKLLPTMLKAEKKSWNKMKRDAGSKVRSVTR